MLIPDLFATELDADKDTTTVAALAHQTSVALLPQWNVKKALAFFERAESETLAVVESEEAPVVIGLLNEAFATRRYAEEQDKANQGVTGEL